MPQSQGLIDLKKLTLKNVTDLFSKAQILKEKSSQSSISIKGTSALLFFEPSTRTRFSFESASIQAGLYPLVLSSAEGTSLLKGETFEDTVFNIEAMGPQVVIVRASENIDLRTLSSQLKIPMINAGWGSIGHPTQALLDTFCWSEEIGSLQSKKLLFVGDTRHSRVVASHLELSSILGYKVGACGPEAFLSKDSRFSFFKDLSEGLQWADAVMVLRFQKERHQTQESIDFKNYQINAKSMKQLSDKALLFHPGPVNWGVEMTAEACDSRCCILSQVRHGVWLRHALIVKVLEGDL